MPKRKRFIKAEGALVGAGGPCRGCDIGVDHWGTTTREAGMREKEVERPTAGTISNQASFSQIARRVKGSSVRKEVSHVCPHAEDEEGGGTASAVGTSVRLAVGRF